MGETLTLLHVPTLELQRTLHAIIHTPASRPPTPSVQADDDEEEEEEDKYL